MDLTPFVDALRRDLTTAAGAFGDEAAAVADRLATTLDPAVRLALLSALSEAADEITAELAPGSVDVRLRGGEPQFVVSTPPPSEPPEPPPPPPPPGSGAAAPGDADDGVTARISLRLPDWLKQRIEEVATTMGISVNAWLVRALQEAITGLHSDDGAGARKGGRRGRGQSLSGWAR